MGLWDKLRGELIDIVEWLEPNGSELLAYRFPRYQNDIKYGAKLTVREGQAAAFVAQTAQSASSGRTAEKCPGVWRWSVKTLGDRPKLKTLKVGVGYPDRWLDYSTLRIAKDDVVGNAERAELFNYRRHLAKLHQYRSATFHF